MEGLCRHQQSLQCLIMLCFGFFRTLLNCVNRSDAGAGAHPVRELHVVVSDAGGGIRHDEQVQRGIPWREILRWK